ncbi:MAG: C39 family peptidase [Candidatus Buchananbacteria bacterium]
MFFKKLQPIKIKRLYFLLLLATMVFLLIAWSIFELTTNDAKGKESVVKKIYYKTLCAIPIKPSIKLDVAYHHQQHSLSCEVASLLMALNYKGVKVTEDELIKQLPISDPGPRSQNNTWGDPDLGFVGDIDGRMPDTGYGVYEKPIYDLALKYRPAKIMVNATLADLIAELANDNPVVVWGVVIGRTKDISWKTPEGKTIKAHLDEHARTLIGFTGQPKNPELIILLDPLYGEVRLKTADFLKNWQLLENRAVVIY